MRSWKRATLQSIRGLCLPGSKGASSRNGYDKEEYVSQYNTHPSSLNVPKLSPEPIDDPITPHCEDTDDEWSHSMISSDTIHSTDTENNSIINEFTYPDCDPIATSNYGPVLKDGIFIDLMTKNISTPILVSTTNTEVYLDKALRPRTTSPVPGLKKMHYAAGNGQLYSSPLTSPTALVKVDLSESNKEIGILSFVAFLDKVGSSPRFSY